MNEENCVAMRFAPRNSITPVDGLSPYEVIGKYIHFVESHLDLGVVVDKSIEFHGRLIWRAAMVGGPTT